MKNLYQKLSQIVTRCFIGQSINLLFCPVVSLILMSITATSSATALGSEIESTSSANPSESVQNSATENLAFDYSFEELSVNNHLENAVILGGGRKILFSEFELEDAAIQAAKDLTEVQRVAFETKRQKIMETFVRLIQHRFSRVGIRYGLIVKDKALLLAARELHPQFVEKYLKANVKAIKKRGVGNSVDEFVFDLLENLYINISQSPSVVADAEEVGYSLSLRLFGNAVIKNQGTGAGIGIGLSVGQNFKTDETVFQLYSEFDYPSASDYVSLQVGLNGIVSYYMKKSSGTEPQRGVYYNPLASPIKPVYGPSFINFSLPLTGIEFPPLLTSLMHYEAEYVRVPLVQTGFSKLSKKFTHVSFLKPPGVRNSLIGAQQGVSRVALDIRNMSNYIKTRMKEKAIKNVPSEKAMKDVPFEKAQCKDVF